MVGPVTWRKAYQRCAQASPNGALPSKKDGRKRTQPAVLPLPHTMAWLQVSRWRGPTRAPLAQPPAVSTRPLVHQGNEVSEQVWRFSGAKTVVALSWDLLRVSAFMKRRTCSVLSSCGGNGRSGL